MSKLADKSYDLAIVDPPYGIGEWGKRNATGDRPNGKWANPKSQIYHRFDDSKIPSAEYFAELRRVSKNQIIWGGNHFTQHLPPSKGWIVWDKLADIKEHLSMCELAWSSFDMKCNKFEYLWAGFKKAEQVERIHPTQKPVSLYVWLLTHYAESGWRILDTHMGSGSSIIAAAQAGFEMLACEIDPKHFATAVERIGRELKQQTFAMTPNAEVSHAGPVTPGLG